MDRLQGPYATLYLSFRALKSKTSGKITMYLEPAPSRCVPFTSCSGHFSVVSCRSKF